MSIWALADLHLSFGTPNKKMDVFGKEWESHGEKIGENWKKLVKPEDLVLIAGDLSWAMTLEEAVVDLKWIDALPGTKVMIKGNHDYWWGSIGKVRKILPPSCHVIQNDAFLWNGVAVAGTRLWDSKEYSFNEIIEFTPREGGKEIKENALLEDEKIFERELGRLEMSLQAMDKNAKTKIVMTHYPPIGTQLEDSRVSTLLEKYHVNFCLFGHLHNVKKGKSLFGEKNGVKYLLTACDYLNFTPLQVL